MFSWPWICFFRYHNAKPIVYHKLFLQCDFIVDEMVAQLLQTLGGEVVSSEE